MILQITNHMSFWLEGDLITSTRLCVIWV